MSKGIDKIKMIKVKQSKLRGNTDRQALKDAGYSEAVYNHHVNDMSVLKRVREEIEREIIAEGLTTEFVVKGLMKEALGAHNSSDRIAAYSWIGKHLAMFTDKSEVTEVNKDDNQFSLDRLSRMKLSEHIDNKEDKTNG